MILSKVGSVCLFVNGFIFLFYALFVPVLVYGVHWLITLVAILLLVALPAIYHLFCRVHKVAARVVVVLLGLAMIVILVSDLLFLLSIVSRANHDLVYALGNALFIACLFIIGVTASRARFFKWFGCLSLITAIIALSTYFPQGRGLIFTVSLLLLATWSFGLGFNILKLRK
jgi:hypothetical protein